MPIWMIVEDDPDIHEFMAAMFDLWDVQHIHFPTGEEAIDWIDAVDSGQVQDALPELAILDIRLPDIPGDRVGARLRRSARLRDIGIVMITAYRLKPAEEGAILAASGADQFLYKPLPAVPELRALFDDVLAAHTRPR